MHTGRQIFFILCYLRRQRALRLWVVCRTLQILVYICNFPFPRELVLFGRDRARALEMRRPRTHTPRPRTPVARFWKTMPPALFRHHRVCTASMPLYSNNTRQRDKCRNFSIHPAAQARRVVPGAAHLVGPGREMSGGREEGLFPFSSSFPFAATGRLYFVLLVGHLPPSNCSISDVGDHF